jgi:hypothetical protein
MIWSTILVALTLTTPAAAEPLPLPVLQNIQEIEKSCAELRPGEAVNIKKGFITRQDVNGDRIADYILDYSWVQCGEHPPDWCGTGGCRTAIIASVKGGFEEVYADTTWGLTFKTVHGRPMFEATVHGTYCFRSGPEYCVMEGLWNGETFVEAVPLPPARGDRSRVQMVPLKRE